MRSVLRFVPQVSVLIFRPKLLSSRVKHFFNPCRIPSRGLLFHGTSFSSSSML